MSTPPEVPPAITNLLTWLGQAGAQPSPFEIFSLGGGERGVRATTDMAAQELIMRIPRRYVVSVPDARASEIGRLIEAQGEPEDPRLYLSAFVLQERARGEASSWKPFLDSLPKSFPSHPFYFDERELALLKGSFLQELVGLQRKSLADQYAHLCQHVLGFQRFSFEDFAWSYFVVDSRVYRMTHEGNHIACLVPLMDMFNDSMPRNSRWSWSDEGQCFEMTTQSPVARGQEFLTTYGNKSNLRLLFHYGFLHQENSANEVLVSFGLRPEDPLAEQKQRLLGLADPSQQRAFKLELALFTPALTELFSFLRVVLADAEDLGKLMDAPDPMLRARGMLSPGNEQKLIPTFVAACEKQLAGYETSLEEDTRMLREETLSFNVRNCVVLRQGEKQILQTLARSYGEMGRSGFLPCWKS
jgi:histone-lysine N-methyltransferase SETD3